MGGPKHGKFCSRLSHLYEIDYYRTPNKWFLYNRIPNIGFPEIGLQTFGLSYNEILCLFNLFSYLNTCIYSQSDPFTLQSLDREVDSVTGKKFTVAWLVRCLAISLARLG